MSPFNRATGMALERRRIPRDLAEAHEWVKSKRQGSHGMKDAAILNHIKLKPEERGILHVGCGFGTLAIAASRVLHALTANPATIVGIDYCQPLLVLANGNLNDEASRNPAVRNTVQFRCMDVYHAVQRQNVEAVRALFPRGITTIIAVGIFKDMDHHLTHLYIRSLTSLLDPDGRFVLGVPSDPPYCSTAHFVRNCPPDLPPRLVGVLDLAPPGAREHFRTQMETGLNGISGLLPWGAYVDIDAVDITPMPEVWENFISRAVHDVPRGIPVNDEAWLVPHRRKFYNVALPELKWGGTYREYQREAVNAILDHNLRGLELRYDVAELAARRARDKQHMINFSNGPRGLCYLEDKLRGFLGDDDVRFGHRARPRGAREEVCQLIRACSAAITGRHNLERWDDLYVEEDSMLIIFGLADE